MSSLNNEWQEIKIQYSLVKHLKLHSECDEKYKNLYATWVQDEKVYTNALATIATSFPHYSMHDASHSWSIINKIEMILGESRIKQLSPTDTFLILETAFVHDLGMIISEEEQKKLWSEIEFKKYIEDIINNNYDKDLVAAANYIRDIEKNGVTKSNDWPLEVKKYVIILNADYFRRLHNYRSAEVIMHSSKIDVLRNRNNLIQERIMRLIAQISIMHGTNFNDILEKLYQKENGVSTDEIHPRMIACLLRLGDLLDLDNGRFNEVLSNAIYMPESSQEHKEKHQAITHFLVSQERIEVAAICPNDNIYRATRQWFEWLQDELKNLSSKWSDIVPDDFIGGPPSLGDIKLSIKDNDRITEQLNFKFNIDQKVAFEFIEGSGIYQNKLDCIREVIQNALDATKIQIWNDIKSGKYDYLSGCEDISKKTLKFSSDIPVTIRQLYPLNVNLECENINNKSFFKITIEDSGCGISLIDLKRMESVGHSWNTDIKRYKVLQNMEDWMKPTGNFGIGIHSLFMITSEVKIETKSEHGDAYNITFISSKNNGYISTKINTERKKIGTKISFIFRCDLVDSVFMREVNNNIDNMFDIVDPDAEYKRRKLKISNIINNYLNKIKWLEINRKGVLELENSLLIKEEDEEWTNFIQIENLQIKLSKNLKRFSAFARDVDNGFEVYVSLLDEQSSESVLEYDINILDFISRREDIGFETKIYYKDIFCTNIFSIDKYARFEVQLNIVEEEAKKFLNVNRNGFKEWSYLMLYEDDITNIIDIVIKEMWEYVYHIGVFWNNNYIYNLNIVLLALYYKKFCNNDFDLEILTKNPVLDKKNINIKIVNKESNSLEEGTLRDIFNADKVILYNHYKDEEVLKKAIDNDVEIIISKFEIEKEIELLGFNKLEFLDKFAYITYKTDSKSDINVIIVDSSKYKSIEKFLSKLWKKDNYINKRERISAFEYKNKSITYINYIIVKGYEILSPFTNDIDSEIFEQDKDDIIERLRKDYRFNDLVNYVYKNSLNKYRLEEKEYKEKIELGYKELIEDYINFVYREDANETEQNLLSEVNNIINEEVAATVKDIKERDADKTNLE